MDLIQITTLALIQGLTEFLPISSSAHLVLIPTVTGWPDQGLAFDVAVHVGTLMAVMLYFRRELAAILTAWVRSLAGMGMSPDARLGWAVLIGTIPAGLAGLFCEDFIEQQLRSPLVIAAATIAFGLLLGWSDITGRRQRDEHAINWKDVLTIGLAQALALIPGASRSGITMTAGLAVGLTRQAAARFSFLLSIPIIIAAGALETAQLARQPAQAHWDVLVFGAAISAISAFACIHYFLKLLERIGMLPFVVYRLILGVGILLILA